MNFIDTQHRYGFHCSKRKTFTETVECVLKNTPLTAMQIYISSGRGYHTPDPNIDDVLAAGEIVKEYEMNLIIHGCLLYNLFGAVKYTLCANFNTNLQKTRGNLIKELDIAVGLGAQGVVVHPGSCVQEEGFVTACESIEHVLSTPTELSEKLSKKLNITPEEFRSRRCIILENSAGEGTKRGKNLEELKKLLHGTNKKYHNQIKILIDTAHAFGAGLYEWGKPSEVERFYKEFEEQIGLEYLIGFHLNDSRVIFNSKKDRHENLTEGYIFGGDGNIKGLQKFMLMACENKKIVIGEPPHKDKDGKLSTKNGKFDFDVLTTLLKDTKYPL